MSNFISAKYDQQGNKIDSPTVQNTPATIVSDATGAPLGILNSKTGATISFSGGSGTVTSVGITSGSSAVSVSGSPITAAVGVIEEINIGTNLSMSSGTLNASGGRSNVKVNLF